MANTKFLDSNGLLYFWSKVKTAIANSKVTKTSELTNDSGFLTEHQDISGKLDSSTFETSWAQANKILGDYNTAITSMTNDVESNTQRIGQIETAIAGITGFEYKIVTSLPATGTKGVIYLMAHNHGTNDSYDEYIWMTDSNKYEKIGNTDFTVDAITNTEIDTIVAS